jgi:hypothetical protein
MTFLPLPTHPRTHRRAPLPTNKRNPILVFAAIAPKQKRHPKVAFFARIAEIGETAQLTSYSN